MTRHGKNHENQQVEERIEFILKYSPSSTSEVIEFEHQIRSFKEYAARHSEVSVEMITALCDRALIEENNDILSTLLKAIRQSKKITRSLYEHLKCKKGFYHRGVIKRKTTLITACSIKEVFWNHRRYTC